MGQSAPQPPVRIVTATSLFDGHDAAINVMRRLMQREGAEVIHLGHDRSVQELVSAAIQEDAQAIAVSSYQGGHLEFFKYMVDLLREHGGEGIKVFGGGGGTIVPKEARALEACGVEKVYGPESGQQMGLLGMISDLVGSCEPPRAQDPREELERLAPDVPQALARCLTFNELAEAGLAADEAVAWFRSRVAELSAGKERTPVLGITGTGGAGKSSLTDELVRRFLEDFPDKTVAILSIDPTQRRTGGALLGDRIRMNALASPRAFMRSLATRRANLAVSAGLDRAVALCKAAGHDLVIVETAGIGQSDVEITELAGLNLYVMTPDFGAASQLEKIGMLDEADLIAINKFDKPGAQDALRDVRKQVRRNRGVFDGADEALPVYGTVASRFMDPATDRCYAAVMRRLAEMGQWTLPQRLGPSEAAAADATQPQPLFPPRRVRYLSDIADTVRGYKAKAAEQAKAAQRVQSLGDALTALGVEPPALDGAVQTAAMPDNPENSAAVALLPLYAKAVQTLTPEARAVLVGYEAQQAALRQPQGSYRVRGRDIVVEHQVDTLAGTRVPKVALPTLLGWGDRVRWELLENLPGHFPFAAGVFPFKRKEEEPTRMFAGEGLAERTNRRFHFISSGMPAKRLSTAFDSVTLYGQDPHPRPDIYGKVGNSGVSICTLDDMKRLYSGFTLTDSNTSVSMTINGPAPVMLAFFLNTAIDQEVERHLHAEGQWKAAHRQALDWFASRGVAAPSYREDLPPGHDGLGLGLLGIGGERLVPPETYAKIREATLQTVRGTVQADILKEDQAQNTCIFSTEFALKVMGDMQSYFCTHDMPNFYTVSVSGYHMAEAGANPITQAAFTLANGFTYVEYYLSRGLKIDAFARNLSFFFSNGMDAEYAVIGRVARRIWAVALREQYRAGERAQKLKYHIQTSGRSLHAQEIGFNDIRTTLQALYGVYDNCNSMHTNAYDEAITTPTEESVRRALAIQLIINRELGMAQNHNPLQGSYLIEELTDLVEEAILAEFDRLTERGGVLGAMETRYQRTKIQEESLLYEERKYSGELPIVGINTFLAPDSHGEVAPVTLSRSTDAEKDGQTETLRAFQALNAPERPAALSALQETARRGGNVFEQLMETVKSCSLGEIVHALYDVGGRYRRNM